jgi:general stress protein 26
MVVQTAFTDIAHRVVWCTVATVDRRGRPRSRVLHPIWETAPDGTLTGWITTRTTPLKVAHLARTPFVSCSYWSPDHDTAVVECHARWETDLAEAERVWELFRTAPEPLGHDPSSIWPDGPASPDAGLLRLDPWRLRAWLMADMVAGRPALTWRSGAAGTMEACASSVPSS